MMLLVVTGRSGSRYLTQYMLTVPGHRTLQHEDGQSFVRPLLKAKNKATGTGLLNAFKCLILQI